MESWPSTSGWTVPVSEPEMARSRGFIWPPVESKVYLSRWRIREYSGFSGLAERNGYLGYPFGYLLGRGRSGRGEARNGLGACISMQMHGCVSRAEAWPSLATGMQYHGA